MKSQAYRMTMLFDFYGDVLTDRQKEFYDRIHDMQASMGGVGELKMADREGITA